MNLLKCAAFNSCARKGLPCVRVKDFEWCFMRNSGGTVDLFHPEVCILRFIFLYFIFERNVCYEMDGS